VAGKVDQPVILHDGNDRGVIGEQAVLFAQRGRGEDEGRGNGQSLDPRLENLLYRCPGSSQVFEDGRVLLETLDQLAGRPAETRARLDG
jgi:hypothetical protein